MRLDIDAEVVDRGGDAAGWLSGLVFERESRRVAGFLDRREAARGAPGTVLAVRLRK